MIKFEVFICEECEEHFAVEKDKYDEPACQCGSTNTIFICDSELKVKKGD